MTEAARKMLEDMIKQFAQVAQVGSGNIYMQLRQLCVQEESAPGAITEWDPKLVRKIVALGFDEEDAKEALAATDGAGKNHQEQVQSLGALLGLLLTT
jgi:aromatic ring-opening dioxygenase catalytic subunit (LigB family)